MICSYVNGEFTSLFNLESLINPFIKIAIYFKYNKTEEKQLLYNKKYKKKSYFLLIPTFDINFLISRKYQPIKFSTKNQVLSKKSTHVSNKKLYF